MNKHKHTDFKEYMRKTDELYRRLNVIVMILDNTMDFVMSCSDLAIGSDFNVLNECYKRLASMRTYTNGYARILLINIESANNRHYHRKRKKRWFGTECDDTLNYKEFYK